MRQEILSGKVKAGDRLPPVREMSRRWNCTAGTVQRAYQELSRQGLVHTRAGQGTTVSGELMPERELPCGAHSCYTRQRLFCWKDYRQDSPQTRSSKPFDSALDRWRSQPVETPEPEPNLPAICGQSRSSSGDDCRPFSRNHPGSTFQITYTGSLGGLIALAQGKADLGGCHLWDEESDTYNIPFVRRLLPGMPAALVTLAHRRVGLITPPGNPAKLS